MTQTSSPPKRTKAQLRAALKKGNNHRSERARFKAQMKRNGEGKSAKEQALELLTDVPSWAETMKLVDLLMAIPKVGKVRVTRMTAKCRIAYGKTLAGLSERQRGEIATEIENL